MAKLPVKKAVQDEATNQSVQVDVTASPVKQLKNEHSPKVPIPNKVIEAASKVDDTRKPDENTKIRMRVDHCCTIAKETYDLKAGVLYHVPKNVKAVLNRAGLLAPI